MGNTEAKYMRVNQDGVYYITESEALAEEKVTVSPTSEWDYHAQKANTFGDVITKLQRQMYFTSRGDVLPLLRQAHYVAVLRYTEHIIALGHISPGYISEFHTACLSRQQFLERKLELMQKVWRENMFTQFVEILLQYEVICEQVEALSVGVASATDRKK